MNQNTIKKDILNGKYDNDYYEFVFNRIYEKDLFDEESVMMSLENNTYLEDFIEYMENKQ